jgi:hypothetical protein
VWVVGFQDLDSAAILRPFSAGNSELFEEALGNLLAINAGLAGDGSITRLVEDVGMAATWPDVPPAVFPCNLLERFERKECAHVPGPRLLV